MNTIVLMGRLARDPETKLTSTQKGQTKVSRFPLVVKRNRTSKAFVVMITAYGNNAESASTISEEVQEFVNLTITEHMGKAYSEWKLNQDKEPVSEI